jgi:hypothetical protein
MSEDPVDPIVTKANSIITVVSSLLIPVVLVFRLVQSVFRKGK